jgi:hypothetical protein
MAIITSKTVAPPHPQVVVKWVDYTNKFGLGYILNDGSIGCVLREIATPEGSKAVLLPPACMVIQDSERHVQLRQDERYADRHQPVPMNRNVHFFENRGEAGLAQLTVSPEEFRVPVGDDGVPAKLGPGSDAYQYRKRERIILWKKFANYMIAYGRDDGVAGDASPLKEAMPSGMEEVDPAQVVIFYQRFGDVGCWVFCDGHLQVRSFSLARRVCFNLNQTNNSLYSSTSQITQSSSSTRRAPGATSGTSPNPPPPSSPTPAS